MGLYAGQIQGGSPGRGRKGAVVVAVVVSCSKMKACYSGFLNKAQAYTYTACSNDEGEKVFWRKVRLATAFSLSYQASSPSCFFLQAHSSLFLL